MKRTMIADCHIAHLRPGVQERIGAAIIANMGVTTLTWTIQVDERGKARTGPEQG
jgi:hypothetical protein